jgi:hypothetical protein
MDELNAALMPQNIYWKNIPVKYEQFEKIPGTTEAGKEKVLKVRPPLTTIYDFHKRFLFTPGWDQFIIEK